MFLLLELDARGHYHWPVRPLHILPYLDVNSAYKSRSSKEMFMVSFGNARPAVCTVLKKCELTDCEGIVPRTEMACGDESRECEDSLDGGLGLLVLAR